MIYLFYLIKISSDYMHIAGKRFQVIIWLLCTQISSTQYMLDPTRK